MPMQTPRTLISGYTLFALLTVALPTIAHEGHEHQAAAGLPGDETPFLRENNVAMDKMMAAMETPPTGDIDRDFVAMMSPHHQGAIDMAVTYLKYGRNEQLKRLAQEIIVEQQQEIAAMQLAIGAPLPPSTAAPTQTPTPLQP